MASVGGPFGAYGFGSLLDSLFGYQDPNQYRGDLERSGNNAPSTYFADMYPNPNEQMLNLDNNIFANRFGTAVNDSFQKRFGNLPTDNRTLASALTSDPPNLFGPMPGQYAPSQPEGPLPPANAQYTSGAAPTPLSVTKGLTQPAPYATDADTGLPGRTTIPAFGFNGPSAPPPSMEPGIGDRLSAAAHGLGKSGPLIPALVNMVLGGITGTRQDPEGISMQNAARRQFATFQALMQTPGMTPEMARAGALDPAIGHEILKQPEIVKEWALSGAKAKGIPLNTYVRSKMAPIELDQGTYKSLVPPESVGAGGVTGGAGGVGQPGGPAVAGGMPAPAGTFPVDLTGKAAAEASGKLIGTARAQIPAAIIDANNTIRLIDELSVHKGLPGAIGGLIGKFEPVPGTPEYAAYTRVQQLQGEAFLQARQLLKGGGQITDFEGKKAENAIARMDRATSEPEFRAALKDFRDAVKRGVQKLEATGNLGSRTINAGNGITITQVR